MFIIYNVLFNDAVSSPDQGHNFLRMHSFLDLYIYETCPFNVAQLYKFHVHPLVDTTFRG